jgi:hypothetical protein
MGVIEKELEGLNLDSLIGSVTGTNPKNGTLLVDVPEGGKIDVHTMNSLYELIVVDGKSGKVMVKGGKLIDGEQEAVVLGSSFGPFYLKPNWIGEGMQMAIYGVKTPTGETTGVTTSTIQSIQVRES